MSSNNPNRVYLDTETTGLHPEEGDEILSLTIVDANGRLLFDERFKPKHKKEWPEAQAVNHISPDDVEHLTTIDAYMEQICRILDRIADEIVGYNIAFDIGFLKAAGATINPDAAIIDTMQEFMDAFGNSNTGHRYQPLSMAAERLGYNWTSAPHGSLSDTLACLAAQKCVDDHNWCVENLELTEDAIMHAKPIENGSEGLPKDCWDLNPGGRPFAVTEPILHRLQSSAKLCARAGTTTQFTRMTVNQWFDKAERSQRSPLGRSVDIGRAASALKGVAAVLDMYDPDGVPVIAYFFPNGYGTKTNDNGCSNVIASLYGRDNFTSYLARAANEEKILYIDSEKYEQMEKELPRYGGTRFPPALAALSMDIIIPSSYICKMKAEINPKLSDREREHNSLNRTMHIKVADSRRNRLAQDRDKPRNITLRYDDDNRDSQ